MGTVLFNYFSKFIMTGFIGSNEDSIERQYDIRFGVIEADSEGFLDVTHETEAIPLLLQNTGFSFGYLITPPDDRIYTTHEVLYLPAAPRFIDFNMPVEQKADGRIIKTPNIIRQKSTIYPYSFSTGDPVGPWKLDIHINDELYKTIRFMVYRPEER